MELLSPRRLQAAPRRQGGAVLVIALIVLLLMSYAAVAVVRSTDTGGVIAGNFAFRQSTTHASDQAITAALNTLAGLVSGNGGNTAVSNRYFTVRQDVDSLGIPSTIDWSDVSCNDEQGVLVADCEADPGAYRIQYVIERQCSADPDLADLESIKSNCDYVSPAGASVSEMAILYRVIVRARGPRGTAAFFEVMLSGPATS